MTSNKFILPGAALDIKKLVGHDKISILIHTLAETHTLILNYKIYLAGETNKHLNVNKQINLCGR